MQIDVPSFIGAVVRRVEDREHKGTPVRVVVASRRYDTDVDDLWDALTRDERIPRWFLPISGDLRLGGKYQFEGNAGGTITECEPPHRLAVTWEFGGGTSWVNVWLSAVGGRTELVLEHLAPIDPHWETYGPGAVGIGWDLTLIGLGLHLAAGGAAVDKDEFAAEGWCAADVANGEDPAKARAAADQTAKFYTGG
jgi:uncharacterized protein YndB with AHSA1/START domain